MKKLSLLPTAEKIWDDNTVFAVYNREKFGINVPFAGYVFLFCIMILGFIFNGLSGLFLFGTAFLTASLDNHMNVRHNGKKVENTMWNRIPFTIIGLTIMTFCIYCFASEKEETETGATYHSTPASRMVLKLYAAFIIALVLGRFIFIIASLISAASRKKRCTYTVSAMFAEPPEPSPKVIYKYEFEGESFCFIYNSNAISPEYVSDYITLDIDPDAPYKYYTGNMKTKNIAKLKHYLKSLALFLFITALLWVPLVWVQVITPLMVEKW